ncbi:MAG: DDE-type integrase/transposase/recombinase [Chloroflexi bacterium]|nr:DDE-type integrase/transposase/recombinase [Chloroflexota bacterium]
MPHARRLARVGVELSRSARLRLQWMDHYEGHGGNAAFTCRHFGISRQTFYRWRRRYDPRRLASLEDRSHRPRRSREPTWTRELALAVLHLREEYPRWGKDKLVVLLRRSGWQASTSMVGRILTHLKARGVLVEPVRSGISTRKRLWRRPYATRKPKDYEVLEPGDLVEVDTLDVRPLPGVVLKHFTARDLVSRWDVLEVHTRATATTAAGFLDALEARMPFPVRAIQVDGGSEFQADFEQSCQDRGIRLFTLPPRSPKLNGAVERAQRTHTEEFYEVTPFSIEIVPLNRELQAWELTYNTIRPHQALGYLTPQEFLAQLQSP